MKIVGLAYTNHRRELLLKSDSSLLVNKKPFFVPEWATALNVHPCLVLRVCKLGKDISPRFAPRYVDAFALGLHIEAKNVIEEARKEGRPWTVGMAFDGTSPVGTFVPLTDGQLPETTFTFRHQGEEFTLSPTVSVSELVSEISRYMTIRQGDMLFLCADAEPMHPAVDQAIEGYIGEEENLYCKIK